MRDAGRTCSVINGVKDMVGFRTIFNLSLASDSVNASWSDGSEDVQTDAILVHNYYGQQLYVNATLVQC